MGASRQQGSKTMSCRRINRWVLRYGTEEIPSEWRGHIDSCPACRSLVAEVQTLDIALSETAFPDPGEAYWAGFAPQVARRLETAPVSRPAPVKVRRPAWARVWAPAVVAATLAFLIGRDVYLSRQTPPLTEKEVPVVTKGPEKPAGPTTTAAPSVIGQKTDHQESREPTRAAGTSTRQTGIETPTASKGSTPRSTEPVPQVSGGKPVGSAATPQEANSGAVISTETPSSAEAAEPVSGEARSNAAQDSKVWPDRRVTIMGEIAADTEKGTREDNRGLPGQGPHGLSEHGYLDGAPGAETVRTLHPPERLEAPQLRAAPGFPDSQSPAEAMRRLDQLAELRRQIGTLQAIDPSLRTPAQNRELCALWYRVGTLAVDRPLIDSALQQLGPCLKAADQSESAEWKTKSDQLREKLSKLPD